MFDLRTRKKSVREASPITRSGGVRVDIEVPEEFQLCITCEKLRGDYRSPSPTPIARQEEFDAWKAYLARWTLNYPVKAVFDPYIDKNGHLRVDLQFPEERDARNPEQLLNRETAAGLLVPSKLPDSETPRWLRANLLYHLSHELDEWLKFDNESVFDPHVDAVYTCEICTQRFLRENDIL